MKRNGNKDIRLTEHAYLRYCERVEVVTFEELDTWIQRQVATGNLKLKKSGFIRIEDLWFVARRNQEAVYLITCYGRGNLDMLRALIWADRFNDRINLNDMP